MINKLFATTLETQLNQALHWDQACLEDLNKLSGKIIRLELSGLDLNFTFFPDNQGIIVLGNYNGELDVRISCPPFSLLRLLLETTQSDNTDVIITGEISTAQQFLLLLRKLDIDLEERLAQWLGTVPMFQNLNSECRNTLQDKLREYLQEKTHHLPTRVEMETFLHAVNTLSDDLERLEQRVQRLK